MLETSGLLCGLTKTQLRNTKAPDAWLTYPMPLQIKSGGYKPSLRYPLNPNLIVLVIRAESQQGGKGLTFEVPCLAPHRLNKTPTPFKSLVLESPFSRSYLGSVNICILKDFQQICQLDRSVCSLGRGVKPPARVRVLNGLTGLGDGQEAHTRLGILTFGRILT